MTPHVRASLFVLCGIAAAGCHVEDRYLVDRTAIDALRQLSWHNRARAAVPAVRLRDETVGHLRGDSIRLVDPMPDPVPGAGGTGPVEVRAGGANALGTAGWVVGGTGAVVLAAGAWILHDALAGGSDLGGGVALVVLGAMQVVTGLSLGVEGLGRAPQEVVRGDPRFLFLDELSAGERLPRPRFARLRLRF